MWKWIVGIVVVGALLCCVGVIGGAGWWWWHARADAAEAVAAVEVRQAEAEREADDAAAETARLAARRQDGRARYESGDYEGAVDAYTDVLAATPSDGDALLGRGRALARLDRLASAEPDLVDATRLLPDRKDGWETLAWVLTREGSDGEAASALDHLVALDPTDAKALRDRASARYHTGDLAGARADAAQSCTLGLAEGCTLKQNIAAAAGR
jgi:tetratricopeptide (TPR) repeat protein